jgi:hypothetical protein
MHARVLQGSAPPGTRAASPCASRSARGQDALSERNEFPRFIPVDPIDPRLKAFPRVPASALAEILASGFAP